MKRSTAWLTLFLCLFVLMASDALAAKRIALVIGNGSYAADPLKNPVNDATDMAQVLRQSGFTVTLKTNANLRVMEEAVDSFGRDLRNGGVGLFYFAGHGVQVKRNNYLIPINSKIQSEGDVKYRAVDAGLVLAKMEDAQNDLNIVILDACRNNPFARSFRSADKGLAKMDAPTGSIIAYSTAPGSLAADGDGRNGLYTKYLLQNIRTPGLTVERVLKNVRGAVVKVTSRQQVPWESSSLLGDFYFVPEKSLQAMQTETINTQHERLEQERKKIERIDDEKQHLAKGTHPPLNKVQVVKPVIKKPPKLKPGQMWTDSIAGIEVVWIPAGSFMMGSPINEPERTVVETQHKVTITRGFYMQLSEVTQAQWKAIMGHNPSKFKGNNLPVEQVSWNDVQSFINKLNRKGSKITYRLPTEAEWEYSARAGTTTPFAFGNCLSTNQANYRGSYPLPGCRKGKYKAKTIDVKSFSPNNWGLYDMHGNVWEWCQDWIGLYPSSAVTDPVGPSSGGVRVTRGGGWNGSAKHCRSAFHDGNLPSSPISNLGFRLAAD